MTPLVILNLGQGNCQQGIPSLTVQLFETSDGLPYQWTGNLPAAPHLAALYQQWRSLYEAVHQKLAWRRGNRSASMIKIHDDDPTNISAAKLEEVCSQLEVQINQWLKAEGFQKIEQKLRTHLHSSDHIQIVIESTDENLRKMPWHLWDFLNDYENAEIAIATTEHQKIKGGLSNRSHPSVRILAILGNQTGIDIEQDKKTLESLSDAKIHFLIEPSRKEISDTLWDSAGWDILFFAGHSSSSVDGSTGQIEINPEDSLTIPQLKQALKRAISNGLQLAIFNSCDGVGLAKAIADLHIPNLVVMREPIPDVVAQEFLKYFLEAFSGGQSLYLSVRAARGQLQGLESQYPCAGWLPVICQNPTAGLLSWKVLQGLQETIPKRSDQVSPQGQSSRNDNQGIESLRRMRRRCVAVGLIVPLLLIGVRHLGLLQKFELQAFDFLMRHRPSEGIDDKFLIITISESDIQYQKSNDMELKASSSLSDKALSQLLEVVSDYESKTVGLDIYHDFKFEKGALKKITEMESDFFAICKSVPSLGSETIIPAPSEIDIKQIGFAQWPRDPDGWIRRQPLKMKGADGCQTNQSFSVKIAEHYLKKIEKIQAPLLTKLKGKNLTPYTFTNSSGGYNLSNPPFIEEQLLINYRQPNYDKNSGKFNSAFHRMSLSEILDNSSKTRKKLKERAKDVDNLIILIGLEGKEDQHLTPYSTGPWLNYMSGVELHAHMISQLIHAIESDRPLLTWWPEWVEVGWILIWSTIGYLCAYLVKTSIHYLFYFSLGALVILGASAMAITVAVWIPPISPMIGFLLTSVSIRNIRNNLNHQSK